MSLFLLGIGMVFVIEGLVLALAPSFYDQVIEMLAKTPVEQRRIMGLVAVGIGVVIVWFVRGG